MGVDNAGLVLALAGIFVFIDIILHSILLSSPQQHIYLGILHFITLDIDIMTL